MYGREVIAQSYAQPSISIKQRQEVINLGIYTTPPLRFRL